MPLRTADSSAEWYSDLRKSAGKIIIGAHRDSCEERQSVSIRFAQLDIDRTWQIYQRVGVVIELINQLWIIDQVVSGEFTL